VSEYLKCLHIRKNGTEQTIKLYTTTTEVGGSPYLAVRDGTAALYAKLGATTDVNASALRVRKSGTIYAVLIQAVTSGSILYQGYKKTVSFTVPSGVTKVRVTTSWYQGCGDITESYVTSSSGVQWGYSYWDVNGEETETDEIIAVTAGKTYTLTLANASTFIYWSAAINNMTATLSDL